MARTYALPISDLRYRKLDIIVAICADYFGLQKEALFQKNRNSEVNEPRQIAMYFCRKETPFSLKSIGLFFNRDHATVLHATNKIKTLMTIDKDLRKVVTSIGEIISTQVNAPVEEIKEKNKYTHTLHINQHRSIVLIGFTNLEVENFKKTNELSFASLRLLMRYSLFFSSSFFLLKIIASSDNFSASIRDFFASSISFV